MDWPLEGTCPLHQCFPDEVIVNILSHMSFKDYIELWPTLSYNVRKFMYEHRFTSIEKDMEFRTFRH